MDLITLIECCFQSRGSRKLVEMTGLALSHPKGLNTLELISLAPPSWWFFETLTRVCLEEQLGEANGDR